MWRTDKQADHPGVSFSEIPGMRTVNSPLPRRQKKVPIGPGLKEFQGRSDGHFQKGGSMKKL